jgi:hypothetical protein
MILWFCYFLWNTLTQWFFWFWKFFKYLELMSPAGWRTGRIKGKPTKRTDLREASFGRDHRSFTILVWAPCIMHRWVIYPVEPPPPHRSFPFSTPVLYPVDPPPFPSVLPISHSGFLTRRAPRPVLRISHSGSLTRRAPSAGPSHFPLQFFNDSVILFVFMKYLNPVQQKHRQINPHKNCSNWRKSIY